MTVQMKMTLALLGALAAVPAQASDKRDFETCDGRVHPGKQKDGMRVEVGRPTYVPLVNAEAGVVNACTRALASPRLLPSQTLRKAHLLRARAAAHLKAGETEKALADIDIAEAAAPELAQDLFYKRSMGVSLTLLRALALARKGDLAAASTLAQQAAASRPYALQVQNVSATILQMERPFGTTSPSPWLAASKLDPGAASTAINKEAEIGNFAGVLAMQPAASLEWPSKRLEPFDLADASEAGSKLLGSIILSFNIAYARAAGGDGEGARKDLAEIRGRLDAVRPQAPEGDLGLWAAERIKLIDSYVDRRAKQVEARIAVAEGRPAEAIASLVASPMPNDAGTVELLGALKKAVPAENSLMVPDMAPFEKELSKSRVEKLAGAVSSAMIAVETPRSVVDYEKSRPNILGALIGGALSMGTSLLGGIDRKDGFRETKNEDGTIKVEFIGNTPSAALVQEMTLLRAAEVARSAGKSTFVISERQDFSRRWVTSQYGREISNSPFGYKTEMTIRFVEPDTESERALDAVAIIDALGPLYYEEKQANASGKA